LNTITNTVWPQHILLRHDSRYSRSVRLWKN